MFSVTLTFPVADQAEAEKFVEVLGDVTVYGVHGILKLNEEYWDGEDNSEEVKRIIERLTNCKHVTQHSFYITSE